MHGQVDRGPQAALARIRGCGYARAVKPRIFQIASLAFATLLGLGLVCRGTPPDVPSFVSTPGPVYLRAHVPFSISATAPGRRTLQYVLDWGDGAIDSTRPFESGDTVTLHHRWETAGPYQVRAMAMLYEETERASAWSEPFGVEVKANGIPAPPELVGFPEQAVPEAWTFFKASTADPDGDSVAVLFDFGDAVGLWSMLVGSGETVVDSHRYVAMETVLVRCMARDAKGTESDWSEPETLVVGEAGAVLWWREGDGLASPVGGTVLTLLGGAEEVIVAGRSRLYALGLEHHSVPAPGGSAFSPFPAYCARTGHIVLGCDDGTFRAFTPTLHEVWAVQAETSGYWGASAVRENRLYAVWDYMGGIGSHALGRLWCFRDEGTSSVPVASFDSVGVTCPPVVLPDGGVVVGRWGEVSKLAADLDSVQWSTLVGGAEVTALAVDASGRVVYASSGSGCGVLNQDGSLVWSESRHGVSGIAVGTDAIFLSDGSGGSVVCLGLDGTERWETPIPSREYVGCTPLLSANGLLFVVESTNGVLWCLAQGDGSILWSVVLARGAGPRPDDVIIVQPSLTRDGNIIAVWDGAFLSVKGYEDGTLDTDAPWPKWQRDHYNTGSAR